MGFFSQWAFSLNGLFLSMGFFSQWAFSLNGLFLSMGFSLVAGIF
jgi:hypothetical protein